MTLRPNWLLLSLLGLLVAPAVSVRADGWREALAPQLRKPPVGEVLVEQIGDRAGDLAQVRVSNRSDEALFYFGYAPNAPQLFLEEWAGDRWLDANWMWCGTGLSNHRIDSGKSATVEVRRHFRTQGYRIFFLLESADGARCSLILLLEETKPDDAKPASPADSAK